ncbi:MAG: LPXTG cell wall anchor domain-containing protein [Candidatus Limivicinus sp.]
MNNCKRIAALLLCLLAVGLPVFRCLPITASAREVPEEGRIGSITVTMRYGGKPLPGGELTIYQVGKVDGADGDYWFRAKELYKNWDEDIRHLEDADVEKLAAELAVYVEEKKIAGIHAPIDDYGKAVFDNYGHGLQQGLYLVIQTETATGFEKISPFLVSLPYYDGEEYVYHVTAAAKNELEQTAKKDNSTGSSGSSSTSKPGTKLPQTGQLNWPVPVMVISGMTLFVIGWVLRFRKRDDHAQ